MTENLYSHLRLGPSPIARHVLHPFKVGLGITARAMVPFLKFAALIAAIAALVLGFIGIVVGIRWLILWSPWTLIPLSIPVILVLIWLVGAAALSVEKAQAESIHHDRVPYKY